MAKTAVAILLLFAAGCGRNRAKEISRLSEEFVYTSISFSPIAATGIGLHEYQNRKLDDLLDDWRRRVAERGSQAADPLKVGFVYVGPITDNGWTYRHDVGRLDMQNALGDKITTSYVENVPEGPDCERVLRQLATSGHGLAWLSEIPGVRLTAEREDYVEVHVPDDRDPDSILRQAVERGDRVTLFEIADPSLEEIFVEHVGRRAVDEEEEHLATTVGSAARGADR